MQVGDVYVSKRNGQVRALRNLIFDSKCGIVRSISVYYFTTKETFFVHYLHQYFFLTFSMLTKFEILSGV